MKMRPTLVQPKLIPQPGADLVTHDRQLRSRRLASSLKEVVGTLHPEQPLRFRRPLEDSFHNVAGTVLIVVAAKEKLRLRTSLQKVVDIVSTLRVNRQAQTNQTLHPLISAAGAQANVRTEGEAGEQNRTREPVLKPAQRSTDIVLLALPIIEGTLAQPNATEVEPQHRQPEGREGLHRVVDDLVVHRPAARRMGMTHQRSIRSIIAPRVQQRFQSTRRTVKIVYRLNMARLNM
jgi:hypothetical protein